MENYLNHITIHSDIRFGKSCIKDTRIAVSDILTWLASGMTMEEILEDYPELNKTHIYAALQFAARREEVTKILNTNYETVA